MEMPADAGTTISVYSAEPGSCAAEALNLLDSWAATSDHLPDDDPVVSNQTRRGSRVGSFDAG